MSTINENEWDKMLLKYKFAKTILEAELEILLKEYEYRAGNSPVEHIKSRLKKLEDKGYD